MWLDANQLSPGSDWEKDLDNALDAASAVVLVGSREGFLSAYVWGEWHRALQQNKRIIVAGFRTFDLPPELAHAPVVDFRGAFQSALKELQELLTISELKGKPPRAAEHATRIPRGRPGSRLWDYCSPPFS